MRGSPLGGAWCSFPLHDVPVRIAHLTLAITERAQRAFDLCRWANDDEHGARGIHGAGRDPRERFLRGAVRRERGGLLVVWREREGGFNRKMFGRSVVRFELLD